MTQVVDAVSLEILRMARELVINEYTDLRADIHNRWLAEYERVWRMHKVKVPYPSIPPYPTEVDIVKRAQVLFEFIMKDLPTTEPTVESTVQPIVETTVVPSVEPIVEPTVIPIVETVEPMAKTVTTPVEVKPEPEVTSDHDPATGKILPMLYKKVEEMRNNWKKP
jgi:hypothetical protein